MKNVNKILLIAMAGALAMTAGAQTLQVGGVGSSAMYNTASLAAYQLAGGSGSSAGHFTASNAGQIVDGRDAAIVNQTGNLAVVWDNATAPTKVWFYLSVDSVVGNRAYFSQPRATLLVTNSTVAGNKISSTLWGADAAAIPSAVLSVINTAAFTAAFTDILPADAEFAEQRVNCNSGTPTLKCLGYGTSNPSVGTAIQSEFTTANAQPVAFNIYGNDPITNTAIPAHTVVDIGVSPIVFVVNRSNAAGLGTGVSATSGGTFTNIAFPTTAQLLFTGTACDSSSFGISGAPIFPINPILREPISGTMNTTEFNVFAANDPVNLYFSQEGILTAPYTNLAADFTAFPPATNNPLNGACPGTPYASGTQGARKRAIGTGEEVGSSSNNAGVYATTDSIGYTFFSYGNVAPLAGSLKYGYLQFENVDPINPSGHYNTPLISGGLKWPGYGQLPTCTAPCFITPGSSFPNVRNGAYRVWSLLRSVADSGTTNLTNLQTLATTIQNEVNATVPDFVPFNATTDGDPGLLGYRIHFAPPGVNFNATNTPNNGITNPALEAGGDVGGCLDYKTDPNVINCRY